ncbi:YggS family pyridoxal phosphate-dependent enzyme [Spirulina sp. CS-785/01]|uniref:YggS family pyridoxal phosphate-dependent enzyme n=1 Tax=Spirulina sp. CS-785/01 TaxID=3021716 RepID=UPI00232BD86E|nr:YggS family pyridoxal phosphate-dependent enzyme [Spirulina sp. CS-785/01]MDB9314258.1 YggS family pyridoxal phosphate-dependent enzyme [Spirulina sp. CS-785/01]
MTGSIAENLAKLRQNVPDTVRLIAVTKTFPSKAIRAAYDSGIRDFAESRIQEALDKQEELQDLPDICWHFIGHLQSNKAKKAIAHFPWIHTCDSLKLAKRLDRLAGELEKTPKLCLQVKVLPDADKYGWTLEELWSDLPEIEKLSHLEICGLMTILPMGLSEEEALGGFEKLRSLRDEIQNHPDYNFNLPELSMGMSADYPLAIKAGATMIRLGRVIFGER